MLPLFGVKVRLRPTAGPIAPGSALRSNSFGIDGWRAFRQFDMLDAAGDLRLRGLR